jgi:menaquinone-dependent protoporphyrinogen oxidase
VPRAAIVTGADARKADRAFGEEFAGSKLKSFSVILGAVVRYEITATISRSVQMKPIAVLYATREGQTRKIAERVVVYLREYGYESETINVRSTGSIEFIDLNAFSGAIIAASVHAGEHEREMVKFVKAHVGDLDRIPNCFLSVTLSQASVEMPNVSPADHEKATAAVKQVMDSFFRKTGWTPRQAHGVAGALLYTKYNPLIRYMMKRIAKKSGGATDTSRDYEYTDWHALKRIVEDCNRELRVPANAPLVT